MLIWRRDGGGQFEIRLDVLFESLEEPLLPVDGLA